MSFEAREDKTNNQINNNKRRNDRRASDDDESKKICLDHSKNTTDDSSNENSDNADTSQDINKMSCSDMDLQSVTSRNAIPQSSIMQFADDEISEHSLSDNDSTLHENIKRESNNEEVDEMLDYIESSDSEESDVIEDEHDFAFIIDSNMNLEIFRDPSVLYDSDDNNAAIDFFNYFLQRYDGNSESPMENFNSDCDDDHYIDHNSVSSIRSVTESEYDADSEGSDNEVSKSKSSCEENDQESMESTCHCSECEMEKEEHCTCPSCHK